MGGVDGTVRDWTEQVAVAHRELIEHLGAMAAEGRADPAAPSLLPGWTHGHVLTHLARNADAFVGILGGVERGERGEMYPGGAPARNAAIDEGSARRWDELVADVATAAAAFDAQVARQRSWDGEGTDPRGNAIGARDIPLRRLREVLVHHADLGDPGFTAERWPDEYVREELRLQTMLWNARRPMGVTGLPPAALAAPELTRLRWLLGRADIAGLDPAGQLP
jgi:maleylpyruvate isomerase